MQPLKLYTASNVIYVRERSEKELPWPILRKFLRIRRNCGKSQERNFDYPVTGMWFLFGTRV
jgi:hypothetical protein